MDTTSPGSMAPLERHLRILQCTRCGGTLTPSGERLRCDQCGTAFGTEAGLVNFAPGIPRESSATQPSRGQRWMEDPRKVGSYEAVSRKLFVRAMGKTWFESFDFAREDAYLVEHIRPHEDGVVLDVACGAGRWTRVLADHFGPNRVIGLDLSYAMLALARHAVPSTVLLRGSASSLPFVDASLGAVNCWNAIQALPDPRSAILEMSRVLRPGGTFTCLTYLKSTGPYRFVQSFLQGRVGSVVVGRTTFLEWIDDAALVVHDETLVGQVIMLTAVRH